MITCLELRTADSGFKKKHVKVDFNWTSGRSNFDHRSPRGWLRRGTANRRPKNHRGNASAKCHLAGIELAFQYLSWNFLFDLQNKSFGVLLHKLTILLYTAKERNEVLTDENTWHINNPWRFFGRCKCDQGKHNFRADETITTTGDRERD